MRFATVVRVAATCVLLTPALRADADQTVAPTAIRPPSIVELTAPWPAVLRRVAATGDGPRLVQAVFEALHDLQRAGVGDGCCNPSKDYFLVSFVAADPAGAPELITVLAHDPMPATIALPGIHGGDRPIYELFLSDDLTSSLQTTYAITRDENPAVKESGAFAAAVIANIALPLSTRPRAAAAVPSVPDVRFGVGVAFRRLVLPETGAIIVRETVTMTHPMGHLAARVASLNRDQRAAVQAEEQEDGVPAACAAFSTVVKEQIDATAAGAGCGLWPADLAACTKRVREDVDRIASVYFAAAPRCPIDAGAPFVQEYLAVIQDVKPLAATFPLGNAPLIRYGFGLAAGYLARLEMDAGHPRARLQGGRIVADPFARQLAMGVVNLTPWGYDAQRQAPSIAERARIVAGVAFSPSFGVTAGGAFEINRYLAVNAGYARLWFDAPKPGEQLGSAPSAANSAEPFALRSAGALFLGVSYNFK
jgi:hypothetical protein